MESFENTVRYICYWGEGWLVGSEIGNCSQHMFRTICLVLKLFLFFYWFFAMQVLKGNNHGSNINYSFSYIFFCFVDTELAYYRERAHVICGICLFWILKCFFIKFFIVFLVNRPFLWWTLRHWLSNLCLKMIYFSRNFKLMQFFSKARENDF